MQSCNAFSIESEIKKSTEDQTNANASSIDMPS